MNCVSVSDENYNYSGTSKKQQRQLDKNSGHGTTSRSGGLRSCLRGEIENEDVDVESKI